METHETMDSIGTYENIDSVKKINRKPTNEPKYVKNMIKDRGYELGSNPHPRRGVHRLAETSLDT